MKVAAHRVVHHVRHHGQRLHLAWGGGCDEWAQRPTVVVDHGEVHLKIKLIEKYK
jgi:hypothetical protein